MKIKKNNSMRSILLILFLMTFSFSAFAQAQTVSGTVVNAEGEALPGVTVFIKGTTQGAVTDLNGIYSIAVDDPGATLVFSYVGYTTQEVALDNRTEITVTMAVDRIGIDELVVVGYGTQRKGNLTGSIASVDGDEINISPVANTSQAIVGHLPGLLARQESGMPGFDDVTLSIRGFGEPLVIVDGIESSFDNLDANQIASISILKDGAASIYGSRAGNGVILVTTKRGSISKPTITVNTSYTLQGNTRILEPASSGQVATMERESHIQAGGDPATAPWTEEAIAAFFAGNDPAYVSTDWYDIVFRPWAPQQNHNIGVRGGAENIRYYGYFGHTNQETIIAENGGGYKRYNAQSNLDADITDNLKLSIDIQFTFENRLFPHRNPGNGSAFWQDFYRTRPWFPAEFPDETKVPWGGIDVGGIHTTSNIDLMGYRSTKSQDLRSVARLTYDLPWVQGLSANASVNFNTANSYGKNFQKPIDFYTWNPETDVYTLAASFQQDQLSENIYRSNILTQQYSLNYNREFNGIHRVTALALYEAIDYADNYFSANRSNLLSPTIDQLFMGSTTGMGNDGGASEMGRMSYVGRLNYSLKDRYLIETIIRADASAKFPEDGRWGYFPSVSLGWRLSEEGFMQSVDVINNMKLRASVGQSGNDAVGNFQYLSGYSVLGSRIFDEGQLPGMYLTGLANPFLTWEVMTIYNAGLDFALFENALYGTIEGFYRERTGIPATRATSLPSTFGATLPLENLNSLNDRGFEFELGSRNTIGDFMYDLRANVSWSRAKWVYFDEPDYEDPDQKRQSERTGQWTDRTFGYLSDGLFTSQEEINAYPIIYSDLGDDNSTLRPGDVKYLDTNGDGVLDWKDQVEIGNGTMPHWIGGITALASWKGFDLTAMFQGAWGYTVRPDITSYDNEVEYELRWTEENNDANALVSRLGGAATNGANSDYRNENSWYVRLKNASIGYNIPKDILNRAHIQGARIYISGTNLFTLSNLNKYRVDPEVMDNSVRVYPQQRTISFGLNLTF